MVWNFVLHWVLIYYRKNMLLWSLHPERHKYVCVHFSVSMYIPNFCINMYSNHATNYSFTVSHALTFWYIIIMKIFQASLFCVLELHFLVLFICLHVGKPNTVNYAKANWSCMDRIISESLNDHVVITECFSHIGFRHLHTHHFVLSEFFHLVPLLFQKTIDPDCDPDLAQLPLVFRP